MKNVAVILAGGVGARLGLNKPKQFLKVAGKTVLEHTVDVFQRHNGIDEIAIVMHKDYIPLAEGMALKNKWSKVKKILNGGTERYESSLSAIKAYELAVKNGEEVNLIFHDSVRPLVSKNIIDAVIEALDKYDAIDVAVPAVDTIIQLDESKDYIANIPNRNYLNRGQTPQAFKYDVIKRAYEIALADPNFKTTDDCGLVVKYLLDTKVFVVPGEERNIKLTYPEDIYVLDKLFQLKAARVDNGITLNDLNGKVMVVFGGNSGIGLDMIKLAERHGAKCKAFSRSLNGIDICNFEEVENALKNVAEKYGHIDYIVNSAAVLNKEPLMSLSISTVNKIIDINYRGMVNVSIAAYPYLKKTQGGLLHFTSSSYTLGRAFYAMYSSSKAAVVNFVQAVAEEWEIDGLHVNCINPQRTHTPMRTAAFGIEDPNTLLDSKVVAEKSLLTLLSDMTGEVVDIKL